MRLSEAESNAVYLTVSGTRGPAGADGPEGPPGTLQFNSGQVWVVTRGAIAGGVETTAALTINAPTGAQTNSLGNSDAVKFKILTSTHRLTNGPAEQPIYWNNVISIGPNMANSLLPEDTNLPSARFAIEEKYYQDGVFGVEMHHGVFHAAIDEAGNPASGTGTETRPITVFVPHNKSDMETKSLVNLQGARINLLDGLGNQRILIDSPNNVADITNLSLRFSTNNAWIFQQRDSDGNFVNLLRLNAFNVIEVNRPFYQNCTARQTVDGGERTGRHLNVLGGITSDDDALDILSGPARVGSYKVRFSSGSATVALVDQVYNRTGSVIRDDMVLATGDVIHAASPQTGAGNKQWSWGVRRSATGDTFRIAQSNRDLTANVFFEINPDGVTIFGGPARLKSYTTAGLPSAATAGAGALVYCSDLAGGAAPLQSDGANWTRVKQLVQKYTNDGSYTKPAGATSVRVICIGGGGGGGGGSVAAAGAAVSGGGGGGGGVMATAIFAASDLPTGTAIPIVVGTAGMGGAGRASTAGAGSNGGAGGPSRFGDYLSAFGGTAYLYGFGGGAGSSTAPGTASAGGAGASLHGNGASATSGGAAGTGSRGGGSGGAGTNGTDGATGGGGGAGCNATGATPGGGGFSGIHGGAGGGAGAGITSANVSSAGAQGGRGLVNPQTAVAGGTDGGGAGESPAVGLPILPGSGGGGGGSNLTGNGGAGGAGQFPGGGGGGGGAARAGFNGGAGGAGGAGMVVIITDF